MQATDVVSFADAAVAWINEREIPLSASTERAYRGEVDRMAQFFAVKYGGLSLGEFNQEHWDDYVEELQGLRQHVVTCRHEPLSPSSVAQAIRIGAAFLRWARDEGFLAWAPKTTGTPTGRKTVQSALRRPLVDLSVDEEPLHPAIEALLVKAPEHCATEAALRAQLALGLAYWGGLRSSDIAALRGTDIATEGDVVKLRHPRLNGVSSIQGSVAATWRRYRAAREDSGIVLSRRSPVVAALGADAPISAWSVWALIAQHIEAVTGIEKLYSAQSLRRARVAALGSKCATSIDELSRYARRSRVDFVSSVSRWGA